MKTFITIVATISILEAIRRVSPGASYMVGAFALGWCLSRLYSAGTAKTGAEADPG